MTTTINASTSAGLVNTADTSGILQLQTANTTAVTIDTSQNVGIGTTSPTQKLNVAGTIHATGNGTFPTTGEGIEIVPAAAGGDNYVQAYSRTASSWQKLFITSLQTAFFTSGTERMRIDSSGNVLIGQTTNSQGGRLAITGSTSSTVDDMVFNTNASYAEIQTFNSKPLVLNRQGNNLLVGSSAPSSSTGGTQYYAGAANSYWGNWVNSTVTKNQFTFNNPNGEVGRITTNASATTYNTSSDYRLKENITPIVGALEKVSQLKPVNWTWKVDGSDGQGFIAHELAEIVPDCVTGEKDAVDAEGKPIYQGVDTSFLVATLTAAIQEQQQIITDLKATVDSHVAIINDLKARIEALEAK